MKLLVTPIFTSDRTLRSHFLYVCMSVCMYVCRLNEKAKLIENSLRFELETFRVDTLTTELMGYN